MDAIAGESSVSMVMVDVPKEKSLRAAPQPNGTTVSALQSSVTSLDIKGGNGTKLKVQNSSTPVMLVSPVPGFGEDMANATDCRLVEIEKEECDALVLELEANASAKNAECSALNDGGYLMGDAVTAEPRAHLALRYPPLYHVPSQARPILSI